MTENDPLPSAPVGRSHLPQGDGFSDGGKVCGSAKRGNPRKPTPPVAYGDSPLWDGALGIAGKFPAKVQSARTRQRLPPRGSCQSRQALTEGVQPACAKQCFPRSAALSQKAALQMSLPSTTPPVKIAFGAARRPRQTRNKNNLSLVYVQSAAEHIQNRPQTHDRPAQGSKLHRAVMCKKEDRSLLCRKHRRVARIKESI